jgi:hypothetical protein
MLRLAGEDKITSSSLHSCLVENRKELRYRREEIIKSILEKYFLRM